MNVTLNSEATSKQYKPITEYYYWIENYMIIYNSNEVTLAKRRPTHIGASEDLILTQKENDKHIITRFSPTGMVRDITEHRPDSKPTTHLYLNAMRSSFLSPSGLSLLEQKNLLDRVYGSLTGITTMDRDVNMVARMTSEAALYMLEFGKYSLHKSMIQPDTHLAWPVLIGLSRGCLRDCTDCPDALDYISLDTETALEGIDGLANIIESTHTEYQRSKLKQWHMDISDGAFIWREKTKFDFQRVFDYARKRLGEPAQVSMFFGVLDTLRLAKQRPDLLEFLLSVVDIGYIGIEAAYPINRIVFYKDDREDRLKQTIELLQGGRKGMKIVGIIQTGYEGEKILTENTTYEQKYMTTTGIIHATAELLNRVSVDGVRISKHATLSRDGHESRIMDLRKRGVIVGESTTDQIDQNIALYRKLLATADIDTEYARAITEFPYDQVKEMTAHGSGMAGIFDRYERHQQQNGNHNNLVSIQAQGVSG